MDERNVLAFAAGAAAAVGGIFLWRRFTDRSHKLLHVTPELLEYSRRIGRSGDDARLRELEKRCLAHPRAQMMGAPEVAKLMQLLIKATRATLVVEVGVFVGYTTTAIATALPPGGKVIGLDVSDEYPSVGKSVWKGTELEPKIDLRIAPAVDSMQRLLNDEKLAGKVDLIFIDADKVNYSNYLALALQLIRTGGFIIVDNTLWQGKVLWAKDESTSAIVDVNNRIAELDETKYTFVNLPFADGVTVITKN